MSQLLMAKRHSLNELFEGVCLVVQLTKSMHDDAVEHYGAVARWLEAVGSPLRAGAPLIYPYGSMATGTEVRPVGHNEFDLDQICLIRRVAGIPTSPRAMFDSVHARLRDHDDLKNRLEVDPPALRLRYAGKFCLEVVPARPAPVAGQWQSEAIEIVDYMNNQWIASDPKAYIGWFDQAAANMAVGTYERIAASVDPAPEHAAVHERLPLARTVQLFKRRRDRYYTTGQAPSSTVLTTLAAKHYGGERYCYDALQTILHGIKRELAQGRGLLFVTSPVHPHDMLTRSWGPRDHRLFAAFIERFQADLDELERAKHLPATRKILARMFGDQVSETAVRNRMQRLEKAKETGSLGFTTRAPYVIGPAAAAQFKPIKEHTFFGS